MSRSRTSSVVTEDRRRDGLDLTSMIDVTFLILIFFMCTLQFRTLEGKLSSFLPTNRGLGPTAAVTEEVARLVLRCHADDAALPTDTRRVVFSTDTMRLGTLPAICTGEPTDHASVLEDVRSWLAAVRETNPGVKGQLDVDPSTPHRAVVVGLDAFRLAGIIDVAYTGIPRDLLQGLQGPR